MTEIKQIRGGSVFLDPWLEGGLQSIMVGTIWQQELRHLVLFHIQVRNKDGELVCLAQGLTLL